MKKNLLIFLFLPILILMCGETTEYSVDIQPLDIIYDSSSQGQDKDLAGCHNYEIIPLQDPSQPLTVGVQNEVLIRVKVVDFTISQSAVDIPISFKIVQITDFFGNPAPFGDATLSSDVSFTDAYGFTYVIFRANTKPNLKYTVKISNDCAEDVFVDVLVYDVPVGNIEVQILYEGSLAPSSLSNIKLSLLNGSYSCSQLFPEKQLPETLGDKTLLDIYEITTFKNVAANYHYTIFATAKGPFNSLAASGCHDGVLVLPEKTTKVTLKLYLVTLNPTGMYDCIDHFNFTNVLKDCAGGGYGEQGIAKDVCGVIYEIVKFFQTPGSVIVDLLKTLAKQVFPSLAVDIAFKLFGDAVAKAIDSWVKNASPQWIKDFFTIGNDMLGIITNLELHSDLKISKLSNDFTVQGTHYWTTLVLYWKIGCDPKSPDYKDCGKMEFSVEDYAKKNPNFPLNFLEGKFTASIADFNKLILNLHKIKFNYGKLIIFVLNEILIPAITDGKAHSITEAAYLWINCKGIASSIFGDIVGSITGIEEKDIEDVCKKVVKILASPVENFIGALSLDTELSLQGHCTMVDENSDLKVDKLIDGQYFGFIETGQSQQSSFTGTFEAKKTK